MGVRRVLIEDSLRQLGVGEEAFAKAHALSSKRGMSMRDALRKVEGVDSKTIAAALSRLSGLPVLEVIDSESVDHRLVRPIPLSISRDNGILPLYVVNGELIVGIADLAATAVSAIAEG